MKSCKPQIKILYCTPEKLTSSIYLQELLMGLYKKNKIARFVVDECHCMSGYGHDFRISYSQLHLLRKSYPKVPIMALTATASARVRGDVISKLKIQGCTKILASVNRPNLRLIVMPKRGPSIVQDIIRLIKTMYIEASGIIFCLSQKECEVVSKALRARNIKSVHYHSGLSERSRQVIQESWMSNNNLVICTTASFGKLNIL